MNQENNLKPRIEYWKAAPEAFKAMLALENTIRDAGIDPFHLEFIKLRASQINECAFCVDMHTKDARKLGETDQRLALLPFWREVSIYTPKEKALLRWVEALTKLPGGGVSDEDFAEIRAHFNEAEITWITLATSTINAWNRFGVGFHMPLGYVG